MSGTPLGLGEFLEVVRLTPLVSLDLIVRNPAGEVLLGLRNNEPARDTWFVPGGRVCKNERLADAFRRITRDELGVPLDIAAARWRGVHEHLYDTNAGGRAGFGTHYVVLAWEVAVGDALVPPQEQHRDYRWCAPAALLVDPAVHPHTKAYFDGGRPLG